MIGVAHEGAQTPTGPGFHDAVTFAFGDLAAGVFGSVRLGLAGEGARRASALVLVFAGTELAIVQQASAQHDGEPALDRLNVGGVSAGVIAPLERWRVAFEGEQGAFDLSFDAAGAPGELGSEAAAAALAGLHGYEQPCAVTGSVRIGERRFELTALGQHGHQWGAPHWGRIALARTVSAWFDDGQAVVLAAVRPTRAKGHGDEATSALLFEAGEPVVISDPRLSTGYDASGRQRRAGLELWVGEEDETPHRISGTVLCGGSLELGTLRLDSSFFHWRMRGRDGVGRYDVLRRP